MGRKKLFNKNPICEECQDRVATCFVFKGRPLMSEAQREAYEKELAPFEHLTMLTGKMLERSVNGEFNQEFKQMSVIDDKYLPKEKCYFICDDCQNETNPYWAALDDFFDSPAGTIDWMAHLDEKSWFDPKDFIEMMRRFRKATNSFGGIKAK